MCLAELRASNRHSVMAPAPMAMSGSRDQTVTGINALPGSSSGAGLTRCYPTHLFPVFKPQRGKKCMQSCGFHTGCSTSPGTAVPCVTRGSALRLHLLPQRPFPATVPACAPEGCIHRITESLRLEKTSKIIRSNRHPNTPMPGKPCPEVPHLHGF